MTLTLRHGLYSLPERRSNLEHRYYRAGEFARKAAVSIRTLRFYDHEGLLAPSQVSEAGYRLYTDEDLVDLQQILALKFLGFSLDEIKRVRRAGPQRLPDMLAQQKAILLEKRSRLENIIRTIEETEELLSQGECDWEALVRVIQVIQMDQNKDWVDKYFTPEQRQQLEQLSAEAYSEEARQKLAARGPWTEADQEKAGAQWAAVGAELKRLTAEGADPAGAEAQALARQYSELIGAFTGGDPEISAGLNRFWQNFNQMPAGQRPFQSPWGEAESAYLDKVMAVYRQG